MLYNPPSGSTDPNAPYVGKDVAAGRQGSRLPPTVPEGTQREIVAIIAAAQAMGLDAPTNTDLKQALKAIRSGLLSRFPATGSPDAIAIAPQPVYIALVEGMRFRVKIPGAGSNSTTSPTLAINGLSAPIRRRDGSAVSLSDLSAGLVVEFEIDAALNARIVGTLTSDSHSFIYNALVAALVSVPFARVTSDIWPKPPNLVFANIRGVGSGAGGALGYNNAGTFLVFGGGGGNGGFARRSMRAGDLPTSVPIVVGAPGQGYKTATAGFGPGTDGGDVTFGTFLRAGGGKAAPQPTVNLPGLGGAGGLFDPTDEVTAGANGYGGERCGVTMPTPLGSNGQGGAGGTRTTGGPAYDGGDGRPGGIFIDQYILP